VVTHQRAITGVAAGDRKRPDEAFWLADGGRFDLSFARMFVFPVALRWHHCAQTAYLKTL
jgi:hypothetical protein